MYVLFVIEVWKGWGDGKGGKEMVEGGGGRGGYLVSFFW